MRGGNARPLQTHPEHRETVRQSCLTHTLLKSAVGAAVTGESEVRRKNPNCIPDSNPIFATTHYLRATKHVCGYTALHHTQCEMMHLALTEWEEKKEMRKSYYKVFKKKYIYIYKMLDASCVVMFSVRGPSSARQCPTNMVGRVALYYILIQNIWIELILIFHSQR